MLASERERDATDAAVLQALADKEILHAELEHRTKNITMMIVSFLSLQAARAKAEDTKVALRDVMRRVQGLDVAHRAILKRGTSDRVDLGRFLPEVVKALLSLESPLRAGGRSTARPAMQRQAGAQLLAAFLFAPRFRVAVMEEFGSGYAPVSTSRWRAESIRIVGDEGA